MCLLFVTIGQHLTKVVLGMRHHPCSGYGTGTKKGAGELASWLMKDPLFLYLYLFVSWHAIFEPPVARVPPP